MAFFMRRYPSHKTRCWRFCSSIPAEVVAVMTGNSGGWLGITNVTLPFRVMYAESLMTRPRRSSQFSPPRVEKIDSALALSCLLIEYRIVYRTRVIYD